MCLCSRSELEVDVQPNHLGSSLERRIFGFLLFQQKNHSRGFPYRFLSNKVLIRSKESYVLDNEFNCSTIH
jgi:hypothetical protein